MKTSLGKFAVSVVLVLIAGTLILGYVLWGGSSHPVAEFLMPAVLLGIGFVVVAFLMMYFPRDIRHWGGGKKFLFGFAASVVLIVSFLAAFLGLSLLLIRTGVW